MKSVLVLGMILAATGGSGLAWRMSGNSSDDLMREAGIENRRVSDAARAILHGLPPVEGEEPAAAGIEVAAVTESVAVAEPAPEPAPAAAAGSATEATQSAEAPDPALAEQLAADLAALPRGPSSWQRATKTGADVAAALAAIDAELGREGSAQVAGTGLHRSAAVYSSDAGSFILLIDRAPKPVQQSTAGTVDVVGYRAVDLAPGTEGVTDLHLRLSDTLAVHARGKVERVLAQAFLEQVDFAALGAPPPSLTQ